jgi:hypothetical protein
MPPAARGRGAWDGDMTDQLGRAHGGHNFLRPTPRSQCPTGDTIGRRLPGPQCAISEGHDDANALPCPGSTHPGPSRTYRLGTAAAEVL